MTSCVTIHGDSQTAALCHRSSRRYRCAQTAQNWLNTIAMSAITRHSLECQHCKQRRHPLTRCPSSLPVTEFRIITVPFRPVLFRKDAVSRRTVLAARGARIVSKLQCRTWEEGFLRHQMLDLDTGAGFQVVVSL